MQVHAVLRIALAVSFAALGAAEPYFNCPKGAYLSYKRRAIATLDLARCAKRTLPIRPQLVHPPAHHRRQQREAISAGWQPHGTKDPNYGHTYERSAIEDWFTRSSLSPLTGAELSHTRLVSNGMARSLIREFADRHRELPECEEFHLRIARIHSLQGTMT